MMGTIVLYWLLIGIGVTLFHRFNIDDEEFDSVWRSEPVAARVIATFILVVFWPVWFPFNKYV